jgi:hypothetical protein
MTTAPGANAFERYLNALAGVCENEQTCGGLPRADRDGARRRLEILRGAQTRLQGLTLSPEGASRLAALEESQSGVGVRRTKAAVGALIAEISTQIAERCQTALQQQQAAVPVIPPPVEPPVVPPIEQPVEEELSWYDCLAYEGRFTPSYALHLSGNENSSRLEFGPSLHGSVTLGYNFSDKCDEEFALYANYTVFANDEDFDSSNNNARGSQDSGSIFLTYDPYVFQLLFLMDRSVLTDERGYREAIRDEYLGAPGFGASLYDGWLYPFGGPILGTSYGFYAGVRSSHEWDGSGLGISLQALYSLLYHSQNSQIEHFVGGSVMGTWNPFSLFRIGITAEATADISNDLSNTAANLVLGLSLSFGGNILLPQPIWGRGL